MADQDSAAVAAAAAAAVREGEEEVDEGVVQVNEWYCMNTICSFFIKFAASNSIFWVFFLF